MTEINGPVHWYQGLFLRPQHLQYMQRQVYDRFTVERERAWPFPWGVVEAELDESALKLRKVQFKRLRAVLRSGLEVSARGTTEPGTTGQLSLDVSEWFASASPTLKISLAVPTWYENQANIAEAPGHERTRRYEAKAVEVHDENTGNHPQQIHVRRVNARLVKEGEPTDGVEVLPLLRIVRAMTTKSGTELRHDPAFYPPCMVSAAWPDLHDLLRALANEVESARMKVRARLSGAGGAAPFSFDKPSGSHLEQVLRLRTLGHFAPRLLQMVKEEPARAITPFELYLELRALLGELAGLDPAADPAAADYNHEDLGPVFVDLDQRVRDLLPSKDQKTYMDLRFTPRGRILTAELTDEHLKARSYYLRVRPADPVWLQNGLLCRLLPELMIGLQIMGIKLVEERELAPGLPVRETGQIDFRLEIVNDPDSRRIWTDAVLRNPQYRAMAISGRDRDVSTLEATLLMPI